MNKANHIKEIKQHLDLYEHNGVFFTVNGRPDTSHSYNFVAVRATDSEGNPKSYNSKDLQGFFTAMICASETLIHSSSPFSRSCRDEIADYYVNNFLNGYVEV